MIRKLFRFSFIYGLRRAFIKAAGRLRIKCNLTFLINPLYYFIRPSKRVGFIGAGQFAYATVGYFIVLNRNGYIHKVYDVKSEHASSLSDMYGADICTSVSDLVQTSDVVFILSNHFTHTEYACQALLAGKVVYCEKPISVNFEQLTKLYQIARLNKDRFYVGYNRPHSSIIKYCKKKYSSILDYEQLTLSCFIRGHQIPSDHWYRIPKEGTRICGNVGHWIDLFIHLIWPRIEALNTFSIKVISSVPSSLDDNCIVTIVTDKGDLFSVLMTSRCEPFEGIEEAIEIQAGELNVSINDFRNATVKLGGYYKYIKNCFKDVGHENAINQPFSGSNRKFLESFYSSYITIAIASLIQNRNTETVISLQELEDFFK